MKFLGLAMSVALLFPVTSSFAQSDGQKSQTQTMQVNPLITSTSSSTRE